LAISPAGSLCASGAGRAVALNGAIALVTVVHNTRSS
jgi:hypothetical protein